MRRRLTSVSIVLGLSSCWVPQLRADVITYAAGFVGSQQSVFGQLNLNTGSFSQIATLSVFPSDLAVGPTGTVYILTSAFGTSVQEFATINPANGQITNIAQNTVGLNSMAFAANGTLYATAIAPSGQESLYSINPATGAASYITNLSGAIATTANQLRFIGNTAYTTDFTTPSSLYTINLSTGAPALVGNTGLNANNGLGAYAEGSLFDIASTTGSSLAPSTIESINPLTGAATAIATVPHVYVFSLGQAPEPAAGFLGAGGLMLLLSLRVAYGARDGSKTVKRPGNRLT